MRKVAVVFFCLLSSVPTFAAGDEYVPLFSMTGKYGKETITDRYMKAYHAPTREAAIKEWEAFLGDNAPREMDGFEDITELSLIRQAHYELARLYYLSGKMAEGDRLLSEVDELAVYQVPARESARKWCHSHGYCM